RGARAARLSRVARDRRDEAAIRDGVRSRGRRLTPAPPRSYSAEALRSMTEIFLQLAPIFLYFLIGVLLRRAGVADRSHGDFVLWLAFFVTLPLLILTSVSETRLTADKALLPVANIVVNVLCLGVALLATRPMRLARPTQGSIALSTMIVNNAFMFPFILAIYGDTGFADAVLFDFGNALMVATVTYATAFRYSDESFDCAAMLK